MSRHPVRILLIALALVAAACGSDQAVVPGEDTVVPTPSEAVDGPDGGQDVAGILSSAAAATLAEGTARTLVQYGTPTGAVDSGSDPVRIDPADEEGTGEGGTGEGTGEDTGAGGTGEEATGEGTGDQAPGEGAGAPSPEATGDGLGEDPEVGEQDAETGIGTGVAPGGEAERPVEFPTEQGEGPAPTTPATPAPGGGTGGGDDAGAFEAVREYTTEERFTDDRRRVVGPGIPEVIVEGSHVYVPTGGGYGRLDLRELDSGEGVTGPAASIEGPQGLPLRDPIMVLVLLRDGALEAQETAGVDGTTGRRFIVFVPDQGLDFGAGDWLGRVAGDAGALSMEVVLDDAGRVAQVDYRPAAGTSKEVPAGPEPIDEDTGAGDAPDAGAGGGADAATGADGASAARITYVELGLDVELEVPADEQVEDLDAAALARLLRG